MKLDFLKFTPRKAENAFYRLGLSDFQSLKRKDEIQFYIKLAFFPILDLSIFPNDLNINNINTVINEMKSISKDNFDTLYSYKFDGQLGPGEILLYFILNNAKLAPAAAGGRQESHDLLHKDDKYEVKSARISTRGEASNFRLSKGLKIDNVINKLYDLRNQVISPSSSKIISINDTKKLRDSKPKEFGLIEKEYQSIVYSDYFKNHEVIFLNDYYKKVQEIKSVEKDDVMIEQIISGTGGATITPKIKL